jgi:2-methylisocitrate lyase-like PEP mutase family enzyme
MSADLAAKAERLKSLHVPGDPVVLPTVWDAWSATVAVRAGFSALTVGSHPLADSIGRADGEGMSFEEVLTRVRQITGAVNVPVSVDIESGYGLNAATLVGGLLDAGAVGLNVEDTVHSEGGRFRTDEEHAEVVRRLRQAADAAGVDVVINARTDMFKNQVGDETDRVDRAVARLRRCADAGATSLYPLAAHDEQTLTRLCQELPLPVNAIASPDRTDPETLRRAGVGRISFGPLWQIALAKVSEEWLARWR